MYNDLFSILGLTVHGYGLMIGLGAAAAVFWGEYRAKKRGLDGDLVVTLALWALILGFAGAKILYVITRWPSFLTNPAAVLGGEGFVVYGGIIAGVAAIWFRCRKAKASFFAYADILTPPVALAQAFGRIGCFLAGCCFGKPTDSVLGVIFPVGSSAPAGIPLWPAQLFSSVGDGLLALLLVLLERRFHRDGSTTAAYLLLYSVGRFIIEFFRDDPRGSVGALSTSQFIALFTAMGGIALFYYVNRKGASSHG